MTDEERDDDERDTTPQLIARRVAELLARLGLIRLPPTEEPDA